jgi:phytoene dehydrogenase-like protein
MLGLLCGAGVKLRGGAAIRARRAVVSNATLWDLLPLLPPHAVPADWQQSIDDLPACPSFVHLHLGFDATGELGGHHARAHSCLPVPGQ